MVTLTINGQILQVEKGTTILEAAAQADIHIPHLCYLKGLNEIAACRVCCVEVEGERAMVTACNTPVREGMVVHTNSPRARATRPHQRGADPLPTRLQVRHLRAQRQLPPAERGNDLGILTLPYETQLPQGLRKPGPPPSPCTTTTTSASSACGASRCVKRSRPWASGIWRAPAAGPPSTCLATGSSRIRTALCAASASPTAPWAAWRERDDTQRAFGRPGRLGQDHGGPGGPRGAHRLGGVL